MGPFLHHDSCGWFGGRGVGRAGSTNPRPCFMKGLVRLGVRCIAAFRPLHQQNSDPPRATLKTALSSVSGQKSATGRSMLCACVARGKGRVGDNTGEGAYQSRGCRGGFHRPRLAGGRGAAGAGLSCQVTAKEEAERRHLRNERRGGGCPCARAPSRPGTAPSPSGRRTGSGTPWPPRRRRGPAPPADALRRPRRSRGRPLFGEGWKGPERK
jgi:hypothetical protein